MGNLNGPGIVTRQVARSDPTTPIFEPERFAVILPLHISPFPSLIVIFGPWPLRRPVETTSPAVEITLSAVKTTLSAVENP